MTAQHSTRKYRIGVIGAGARGETFARQLYQGHPRATLLGVCDIDADRLEKFCDYCELTQARRFTDVAAFLAQDGLDGVVITTPEWTHEAVATAALSAGKHIYLEKPMAQDSASCRRIMQAHRAANRVHPVTAFIGFNLRETAPFQMLKEIVDSGVLGQIVHISGLEQLSRAHGASFMRRFHRDSRRSGGLLNHKCSHDLDILQWLIGHQHRIVKVASFGGNNVFTPDKQPATHCHLCPVRSECFYPDKAGFVFPVSGSTPIHHQHSDVYGADLCVFTEDKDVVDNQTVILEWDHGVRGSFELQMFQHFGRRQTCLWGETGYVELNTWPESSIRVIKAGSGEITDHRFPPAEGGHDGSDVKMISRFIEAIEDPTSFETVEASSGLGAGLAATLIAESADCARLSDTVIALSPDDYRESNEGTAHEGAARQGAAYEPMTAGAA